jgi:hypothetical protein
MTDLEHRVGVLEAHIEGMWTYIELMEDRTIGFHSALMTAAVVAVFASILAALVWTIVYWLRKT